MWRRAAVAMLLTGAVAGGIWWAARSHGPAPGSPGLPGAGSGGSGVPSAPLPAPPGREESRAFLTGLLRRLAAGQSVAADLASGVRLPAGEGERLRQFRLLDDPAGGTWFRIQGVWEAPGSWRLAWSRAAVGRSGPNLAVVAWEPLPDQVALRVEAGRRLLRIAPGGPVPVLDTERDLPPAVRPHGAPPEARFGPGRELVAVAIRPDGQQAAFLTRGTHGMAGLVTLSGGTGQVVPLDLYYGGAGREVAWSWDGQWLAVVYDSPRPSTHLALYRADGSGREAVVLPGAPAGLAWTQEGLLLFVVDGGPWQWDPAGGARPR